MNPARLSLSPALTRDTGKRRSTISRPAYEKLQLSILAPPDKRRKPESSPRPKCERQNLSKPARWVLTFIPLISWLAPNARGHTPISRPALPRLGRQSFNNYGGRHTASRAHRNQAILFFLAFKLIKNGPDKNRACRANRMTQRHCSAVYIHS